MRLWSLHPKYLDPAGLVAVWREALLAQAVLRGRTAGYRHHPQLVRFREYGSPVKAVNGYLAGIWREASSRGYRFDRSRFRDPHLASAIPIATGQLRHEAGWLKSKLAARCPDMLFRLPATGHPEPHPLFRVVDGPVAVWERGARQR